MNRQHLVFDELVDTARVKGYHVHLRSSALKGKAAPATDAAPAVNGIQVVDGKGSVRAFRATGLDVLDSDAHHLLGQMGWRAAA